MVSGMTYHDVKKKAEEARLSVKGIVREMKKLKISLAGDKWVIQNKI